MSSEINISDPEILKLIRDNPSEGLSVVLDTYGGSIKTICANILGRQNTRDIEECISDILTELWRSAHRMDLSKGSFRSYLYGIARHRAIDCRRKNRTAFEEAPAEEADLCTAEDPADELTKRENAAIVQNAVDSLPSPDREIFIQRYFLFRRVKDIAQSLQITPKTVENRLYRGKALLKQRLMERGIIL
ncbi:MAG: sigma-70 family RNA polymerase sigma factor [Anaerovoracaceae bacterium]